MPHRSPKGLLALVALAALGLYACPGRLEDPQRFLRSCDANVQTDIFVNTCGSSACHNATTLAGGLDLVSPNVAARVINRPSSTCPGHILVDSPDSGFMFDKLHGLPACGSPMPLAKPALSDDLIFCVEQWAGQNFDGGGS